MLGGTVTISIGEADKTKTGEDELRQAISECDNVPSERVIPLGLKVKWEIGEAGVGGGWKAGDSKDTSAINIDQAAISVEDILLPITRDHAAHLTRHHATPLINNRTPLIEPELVTTDTRPLVVRIPIPSQKRDIALKVSVSPITGILDIEDEGAKFSASSGGDERAIRTRQATHGVNTGTAQLGDALRRLVIAVRMHLPQMECELTSADLYRGFGAPNASIRMASITKAANQSKR
jgi:mediator of RNA polymerase II transcription subunit 14